MCESELSVPWTCMQFFFSLMFAKNENNLVPPLYFSVQLLFQHATKCILIRDICINHISEKSRQVMVIFVSGFCEHKQQPTPTLHNQHHTIHSKRALCGGLPSPLCLPFDTFHAVRTTTKISKSNTAGKCTQTHTRISSESANCNLHFAAGGTHSQRRHGQQHNIPSRATTRNTNKLAVVPRVQPAAAAAARAPS